MFLDERNVNLKIIESEITVMAKKKSLSLV